MVAAIAILSALALLSSPRNMPPLTADDDDDNDAGRGIVVVPRSSSSAFSSSSSYHTSDYGAPKDHPTSYDDDPPFRGPISLSSSRRREVVGSSLSNSNSKNNNNGRVRIRRHYLDSPPRSSASSSLLDDVEGSPFPRALSPSSASLSTSAILKTIVDHLARRDAPVDAKEVAESVEFYLRCGRRLIGAARRTLLSTTMTTTAGEDDCVDVDIVGDDGNDIDDVGDRRDHRHILDVQDLCSGHGLTGMIFLACNPPGTRTTSNDDDGGAYHYDVVTTLVDRIEPKSHAILREIIAEVCPWVGRAGAVTFVESTIEEFAAASSSSSPTRGGGRPRRRRRRGRQGATTTTTTATIVISTHACGSLTDSVLEYAADVVGASSIAVMPCCYTGTADGAPYGVRRALGVAMAADIRRAFALSSSSSSTTTTTTTGRRVGGDYHVDFAAVPRAITPMNRIIVAERRV